MALHQYSMSPKAALITSYCISKAEAGAPAPPSQPLFKVATIEVSPNWAALSTQPILFISTQGYSLTASPIILRIGLKFS